MKYRERRIFGPTWRRGSDINTTTTKYTRRDARKVDPLFINPVHTKAGCGLAGWRAGGLAGWLRERGRDAMRETDRRTRECGQWGSFLVSDGWWTSQTLPGKSMGCKCRWAANVKFRNESNHRENSHTKHLTCAPDFSVIVKVICYSWTFSSTGECAQLRFHGEECCTLMVYTEIQWACWGLVFYSEKCSIWYVLWYEHVGLRFHREECYIVDGLYGEHVGIWFSMPSAKFDMLCGMSVLG